MKDLPKHKVKMLGIKTTRQVNPRVGEQKFSPTCFNRRTIRLNPTWTDRRKSCESVLLNEKSNEQTGLAGFFTGERMRNLGNFQASQFFRNDLGLFLSKTGKFRLVKTTFEMGILR